MKFLFLFFLIPFGIFAQPVDTLKLVDKNQFTVIDSILIEGNIITEEFIILRELTIQEGESVNKDLLHYNRERVYSLGLFNYVDFYLLNENGRIKLIIKVFEKWYFYPLPFLHFNRGNFKDPTYGINFKLENFRGRNETISAYVALGYDPSVRLRYYNPVFLYDEGIEFGFAAGYQDFQNKSKQAELINGENFEYRIYSIAFSLSKRFDQFHSLSISPGYSYLETDIPIFPKITASNKPIDRVISLLIQYTYDSRDLKQFPHSGLLSQLELRHKGFGINDISYNVFGLDIRQYNKLMDDLTARWRMNYRNAFGANVPYYDFSFLGYDEYVRGNRNNKTEGLQYLLGSIELSYAILSEWNFSLDLPLLPKNLTSARIGVNFNIFVDSGLTFDNLDEVKLNNFVSGYGVGLNILFLPFNSVRFEYAFDEYMNGEFIFGLGFSF